MRNSFYKLLSVGVSLVLMVNPNMFGEKEDVCIYFELIKSQATWPYFSGCFSMSLSVNYTRFGFWVSQIFVSNKTPFA